MYKRQGVYNMDVLILDDLACVPLYLIGVKYKNDSAFSKALIVAQNIRQRLPGGVQAGACQFF